MTTPSDVDVADVAPDPGRPDAATLRFDARLFGVFVVVAPDGAVATPAGRKARVVLACLMLSDGEPVSRDRLVGLLWGDRGEEQARASLRQTLYEMRAFGAGSTPLLVLERASARIVPTRLTSDLGRMRDLATRQDSGGLVAALAGQSRDLLADLDGITPEADEWLAGERLRHGDERRRIVLDAAAAALAAGSARAALSLASALLAFDATDERSTRLALEASHRLGDRDSARQAFARLDKALRTEVGVTPSDETSVLYQRVMSEASPAPTPETSTAASGSPPLPAVPASMTSMTVKARRRWPWAGFVAGVGAVALVAGVVVWQRGLAAVHRVILVQPLHVAASDAAAQALRNGLAADLARVIVGHDAMLAVADSEDRTAAAAGEPDFVLTGEAQSDAGQLHADVKLRGGKDAAILWSSSFTRSATELDALREQMSSKIADVAVCALGGHHPAPDQLDLETMRLYLGACEQKHGDWAESVRLLKQVVARNPGFAHGWAMLAAATASVADPLQPNEVAPAYKEANEFARRALALDPNDGEAVYAQAVTLPGTGHLLERIALLEAGHRADPDNGVVSGTLAWNLALAGRTREATIAARQAVDTDPFSPGEVAYLAELRAFGGAREESESLLEAAHRRFPQSDDIAETDFRLAALIGDPGQASAAMADRRGKLVRDPAVWQALLLARAKPSPTASDAAVRALLADAERRPQIGLRTIERLVVVNRLDAALDFATRSPVIDVDHDDQDILFHDLMRPLRADPRFMTLAARQGLVAIWTTSGKWPDFCAEKELPYDCKAQAAKASASAVAR